VKRAPVVVTIDEVRLHGFDPRARSTIGDALGRELTRLFGEGVTFHDSRAVAHADAGSFEARRDAAPAAVAAGIAARVHRTVRQPC
jgi:hypothetical protein